MADDKKPTGQDGQPTETVSKKDFDDLKSLFESVQKAQQGSDKKVQELLEQLKAKDDEIEAAKKAAETANLDKVDQVNAKLEAMQKQMETANKNAARKEFLAKGYKMATDLNVDTSLVDHYGGEESGLEEFLKGIAGQFEARETKLKNDMMAKGYKPNNGSGDGDAGKWNDKEHTTQERKEHWAQYYKEMHKDKAPA